MGAAFLGELPVVASHPTRPAPRYSPTGWPPIRADIKDERGIAGSKCNRGLLDLIDYYRANFPNLMQKQSRGVEMQSAVEELVRLGPLPGETKPDVALLEKFQRALERVKRPVSDDDARALVRLFGPDDCFGAAWTLLHLIETAPNWPLMDCLVGSDNDWVDHLRMRIENKKRQTEAD